MHSIIIRILWKFRKGNSVKKKINFGNWREIRKREKKRNWNLKEMRRNWMSFEIQFLRRINANFIMIINGKRIGNHDWRISKGSMEYRTKWKGDWMTQTKITRIRKW